MARPLIPFVQNGYYASCNWIPLVRGNGFTTSGGGEQEEVWETVSGSIVTFDAVAAPLRQLSVAVEPVQNLNGYDHPWPAGGGKNKLDSSFCRNRTAKGIKSVVNADGSITLTGTSTGAARYWNNSDTLGLVLPAGTYTLSPSNLKLEKTGGSVTGTFTLLEETTFNNIYWAGFTSGEMVDTVVYPQLEVGSTATSWTPYSNLCPITGWDSVNIYHSGADTSDPTEYTIQLGETVYGGTLDVLTGVLTVDRAMVTIDGNSNIGKEPTGWAQNYEVFYINISGNKGKNVGISSTPNILSNQLKSVSYNILRGSSAAAFSVTFTASGTYIEWSSTSATVAEEKARITNEPIQVCYELATPFELTLTPEQISTLQGTNNVWSDAGDVTVEYRAQ